MNTFNNLETISCPLLSSLSNLCHRILWHGTFNVSERDSFVLKDQITSEWIVQDPLAPIRFQYQPRDLSTWKDFTTDYLFLLYRKGKIRYESRKQEE